MSNITNALATLPFLLNDGGVATQLESKGVKLHDTLWSAYCLISHPEIIQQIHYEYLESGANIITTVSYQASVAGFLKIGIKEEEAIQLIKLSIELAQTAKKRFLENHAEEQQRPIFIAGSVGPYGAFLADGSEYNGHYATQITKQDYYNFHLPRLKALASHPALDFILCETIPCIIEATCLAEMMQEIAPTIPLFVSFSCQDETHLSSGESIHDGILQMEKFPQVISVGVNCTSPTNILGIILAIKPATKKYIMVYPNRGEDWDAVNHKWITHNKDTEPNFTELVVKWKNTGANIIGGCCRTSPGDIAAFRNALEKESLKM